MDSDEIFWRNVRRPGSNRLDFGGDPVPYSGFLDPKPGNFQSCLAQLISFCVEDISNYVVDFVDAEV